MRRRQYNESKDGGNGFLGLGRKDRGDSPKFKKSTARLSEVDGGAPLNEVVVSADAPRWLKYQRQYEAENPKEDFLRKNITNFDRKFGNSERNYPKRMDRQYNKRANDYVAEQLRAEYESKNGTRDNSRLRTAEERLKLYDYYNDKEREILKNSKISSWYLPAERQHRIRVSDNPDDYLTESFIKTDSQGNDVFDSESGNRKGYQRLSNQLEGTPERFRVFSNAQNDIEDYVNPGIWLGNMARNLGQAPYKAMKTGSALPIIGALAEPLLSGIPIGQVSKKAIKVIGEERVNAFKQLSTDLIDISNPVNTIKKNEQLKKGNKFLKEWYNDPSTVARMSELDKETKAGIRDTYKYAKERAVAGSDITDFEFDQKFFKENLTEGLTGTEKVFEKIKKTIASDPYKKIGNITFGKKNMDSVQFDPLYNRLGSLLLNKHYGVSKGALGTSGSYRMNVIDDLTDKSIRRNYVKRTGRGGAANTIDSDVVHEGTHGITDANQNLDWNTYELLQGPFKEATTYGKYKGMDISNMSPEQRRKIDYLLSPTEIHARLNELRYVNNLKPGYFLRQEAVDDFIQKGINGEYPIDNNFFKLIDNPSKFKDLMNKMYSGAGITGAGLGLHTFQNQNPEQFKNGGVVGGGDDPKKSKVTSQDFNYLLPEAVVYGQQKSPRDTVYVTDPNDPRLQAYQDSLIRYTSDKKHIENNLKRVSSNGKPLHAVIKGLPPRSAFDSEAHYNNWYAQHNYMGGDSYLARVNQGKFNGVVTSPLLTIKPVQPVELDQKEYSRKKPRYGTKINQIPTLDSEIEYSRNNNIPTPSYNTPPSKYKDGVLKQDFKGVPGVQVWSKRDKETGTLRPVALVNSAGESIDYNKYKDGAFPEGFQHPKKYADGGFINNNMTDPNNYLMAMLTRLQNGRADSIVPPIPSLPIKPIDPTIKPNWPPGNEVPNNPDQPYRPQVSQPQSIAPRPVNPLAIPSRTQDVPNTDNVQYNLPNNNPKPKDPLLGGLLVGTGAAGGTMANIGRPDVGLGTLSGVATGAGYGAMLGPVGAAVGGILGGIGGFASTGLNRTRYDEANAEAQKGKIKAATIYGGDVGSFEFGGNVYSADGEEIVPIQTEKGEKIVSPEGYIYTSKAKQLHKHMDNDLVTDILPSGSYVASNSRAMQILRDKANKMVMGYDTVEYLEGGGSPIPKEHTLGEIMGKKKMTPAEILDIVKNKFPTNQIEYDQFAQKANVLNLKSRLPYINAVISAAKK